MATTTPNFGWAVPTSTDLVKDGAVAIETLGDSIDASLVDLKGGTTGQVLAKASGTDMDFSWTAIDPLVILDAKGDLITATAADTPARLAVGTNGQTLVADSSTSTGLKWATPATASSGLVFIKRVAFSAVSSTTTSFDSVFTTAYESYLVVCESIGCSSGTANLQLQARVAGSTQSSLYYGNSFGYMFNNTLVTDNSSNASEFLVMLIEAGGYFGGFAMWFESVGNTAEHANWHGTAYSTADSAPLSVGCKLASSVNVDGFLLKASAGTITGAVSVYGLAKS
jgi:hypothetical protein